MDRLGEGGSVEDSQDLLDHHRRRRQAGSVRLDIAHHLLTDVARHDAMVDRIHEEERRMSTGLDLIPVRPHHVLTGAGPDPFRLVLARDRRDVGDDMAAVPGEIVRPGAMDDDGVQVTAVTAAIAIAAEAGVEAEEEEAVVGAAEGDECGVCVGIPMKGFSPFSSIGASKRPTLNMDCIVRFISSILIASIAGVLEASPTSALGTNLAWLYPVHHALNVKACH